MRSFKLHKVFLALVLLADVLGVSLSFFVSWWIRFASGWMDFIPPAPSFESYLHALPISIAIYLVVFNYLGLYQRRWAVVGSGDLGRIVRGVVVATLLVTAAGFLYRGFSYSRLVIGLMALSNAVILGVARGFLHRLQLILRRRGVGVLRVAVFGDGEEAGEVATSLRRHPGYGFRLVGFIGRKAEGLSPNLGPAARLEEIMERTRADAVIMAPGRGIGRTEVASLAARIVRSGADCMMLADVLGMMANRLKLEELFGIPVLSISPHPLAFWRNRLAKRAMDAALASIGIVLLSPVFLVLGALVKLSSPGPVFYRQERVGRGGKTFLMFKFRSMRVDAERQTGPVWAVKDDPRRTKIGSFLRKTSLDELPQVFNILIGQMSVVGPRPERPNFTEKFGREVPRYAERLLVKPGLTGWAAVNGLRGNTPVEERTKYDLYYIENWTLWMDVKIIFRTAMEVFHHSDAY